MEYQEKHHIPAYIAIEEGADMGGYHLPGLDHMIISVYGDHLHRNNCTQFDGCVVGDAMWQRH